MPTSMKTGTLYNVEPSVLTNVSSFLQDTVRTESLSMQNIPVERSLKWEQQHYRWAKKNYKTGIAFELDPVTPPDVSEVLNKEETSIPLIYFNKSMTYPESLREAASFYNIQARLQDHIGQMALRTDIFNYLGNTKHGIDSLITTTPATEITTQIDVSTTALAASTTAAAIAQLKTALKYMGLISPLSTIVVEATPSLWEAATGTKSTNEDFNAKDAIEKQLRSSFSDASKMVENHILDATVTIDAAAQHTIVLSTADKLIMYVQDPRIMKIVQSPMVTNISDLDKTKGITFQPSFRNKRIDVEPLGILVETAAQV